MAVVVGKDGREVFVSEPQYTYGIAVHDRNGNPLGVVHGIREGDNVSFEVETSSGTVIVSFDTSALVKKLVPGVATAPVEVDSGKWKVDLVVDSDMFEVTPDNKLKLKEDSIDGTVYLKDNTVSGSKIQDGAITTTKIADQAVIEEKLKTAIDLRLIDGVAMIPYVALSEELKAAYLKAGNGVKFRRLNDGGLEIYLGFNAGTIVSIEAEEPLDAYLDGEVAHFSLRLSPRFAVDSGVLELASNSISSEHINDFVILARHIADEQIESRHIKNNQIKDEHVTTEGLKSNVIEFVKTGTVIINAFFEYGELGWDRIGTWNATDGVIPFADAPSAFNVLRWKAGPYDDSETPYFKAIRNQTIFRFNPFSDYLLKAVIRVDADDVANDVELYFAVWGYNNVGSLVAEPDWSDPSNDPKLIKINLAGTTSGSYNVYVASGAISSVFPDASSEEVFSVKFGIAARIKNSAEVIVDSLSFRETF